MNEKLKEIKARLNFDTRSGTSRYSESRTISTREHESRHKSRRSRSQRHSPSVFSRLERERSRSPRQKLREGVFKRLGSKGKDTAARLDGYHRHPHSKYAETLSESKDCGGGHWKTKSKEKSSNAKEDDLSQPWVCEETEPFTP
ncbi:hypothetical protein Tco_1549139 [Tanacetum coccineum]